MEERRANICGLTAIFIWFLTPLMLGLIGSVPPFMIGAFSFLSAFALSVVWWVWRGEDIRQKFIMSPKAYALGTFGIGLYNVFFLYSIKTGPLLEVNLVNYLWPAFLIIFGGLLQKKKPDATAMAGILLCFVGCFFVFRSRGALSFEGSHAMLMLGALCGLMWGSYSALLKHIRIGSDQIPVFFLIAGSMMLTLHVFLEPTVWPASNIAWVSLVLYMLGRCAFPMWNYAMKHGQARLMGSLSYFIPLFATLALAAGGFADFSNRSLFIGATLIVFGSIVINIKALIGVISSKSVTA